MPSTTPLLFTMLTTVMKYILENTVEQLVMVFGLVVHLETMMVCHSQHLTGIVITGQETVLRITVQDGGTISAHVQY